MEFGLQERTYKEIKRIVNRYNKYEFKIFGSRARGDYKESSDIDIAVFGIVDEKDRFHIIDDFDTIEMPYMVDIVFVEDITKNEFLESIKEDGVLL